MNLVTKGIIDPTKVVRAVLQNAASSAGLLITTVRVAWLLVAFAQGKKWRVRVEATLASPSTRRRRESVAAGLDASLVPVL